MKINRDQAWSIALWFASSAVLLANEAFDPFFTAEGNIVGDESLTMDPLQGDGKWETTGQVKIGKERYDGMWVAGSREVAYAYREAGLCQTVNVNSGGYYVVNAWVRDARGKPVSLLIRDHKDTKVLQTFVSSGYGAWDNFNGCLEVGTNNLVLDIVLASASAGPGRFRGRIVQLLPNLVQNGGMEGNYTHGVAEKWKTNPSVKKAECSPDYHSGNASLQWSGGFIQGGDFSLEKGKNYAVTAWVRQSSETVFSPAIRYAVTDYGNCFGGRVEGEIHRSWSRRTHIVKARTSKGSISLYCPEDISLRIDDVSIVKLKGENKNK